MFTIEEISNTKRKISLAIPAADSAAAIDEAINYCCKDVKVKGFRPGKIPRSILIKQCGLQIRKRLIDEFISSKLFEGINEKGLVPISTPLIESMTIADGQPLACVATFDLYPTFDLPSMDDIELTRRKITVTDEEVKFVLEDLRSKQAVSKTVEEDRPAALGDLVELSYEMFRDNKPVNKKKSPSDPDQTMTIVLGQSEDPNQEFVQGVVGLKIGETRDIEQTFPNSPKYQKLAGQRVTFKVKLNSIRTQELPELDDEFAKDTGFPEVTDLESLRSYIVKEVTASKDKEIIQEMCQRLLGELANRADIEVPESLLERETIIHAQYYHERLGNSSKKLTDPKKFFTPSSMDFFRRQAALNLRQNIFLEKIKNTYQLTATDEDIERELQNFSYVTGQSIEEVKQAYLQKDENFQGLKLQIETRKAYEHLLSLVKVVEVDEPEPAQGMVEISALQRAALDQAAVAAEADGNEPTPDSSPEEAE
ncbi:MAG: trigger factor [Deltaproteobacteria bacterium]|nr:trigger factor [Deltaproteobacteria bacterium]